MAKPVERHEEKAREVTQESQLHELGWHEGSPHGHWLGLSHLVPIAWPASAPCLSPASELATADRVATPAAKAPHWLA